MIRKTIFDYSFQNCNGVFQNCFTIAPYKLLKIYTLHIDCLNLYKVIFSLAWSARIYDST